MKYNFRTDLAIETREAYQKAKQMDIPGVEVENLEDNNVKITRVKVVSEEGANEIGKPIGNYITLEVPKIEEDNPDENEKIYKCLARELRNIIGNNKNEAVLVVGLGNSNVTPVPDSTSKTLVEVSTPLTFTTMLAFAVDVVTFTVTFPSSPASTKLYQVLTSFISTTSIIGVTTLLELPPPLGLSFISFVLLSLSITTFSSTVFNN
jgi:hypothetical protein